MRENPVSCMIRKRFILKIHIVSTMTISRETASSRDRLSRWWTSSTSISLSPHTSRSSSARQVPAPLLRERGKSTTPRAKSAIVPLSIAIFRDWTTSAEGGRKRRRRSLNFVDGAESRDRKLQLEFLRLSLPDRIRYYRCTRTARARASSAPASLLEFARQSGPSF